MYGQLKKVCFIDARQYVIHGDSGYNHRSYLDVPFSGNNFNATQYMVNKCIATVRIIGVIVEWIYREKKQLYWRATNFKRKIRTGEIPFVLIYLSAMLLTNIRTCLFENTVSKYFNGQSPAHDMYLSHVN